MKYLLDTNAWIACLNDPNSLVKQRLAKRDPSSIVLCSIVRAELNFGAMNSHHPERNLKKFSDFLKLFESLPFDDLAAHHYGEIRSVLTRSGKLIGPYDLQIAAIALANKATLVTHNTKEFSRVSKLKTEDWQI